MNCPFCQTRNSNKASFCHHCGNRITRRCPQCDRRAPINFEFCNYCGLPLSATTTEARPRPSIPAIPSAEKRTAPVSPPPLPRAPSTAVKPGAPPPSTQSAAAQTSLQRLIPKELLSKLDAARAGGEMVGERRVVTMLFCDMKGSTAAAEQLDPEDWSEIMNGAFEHMIKPIYAYEGMVARLMGDSILAFFGAPIAHEDDPQRAVLAGLDIIDAIKPYREQIKERHGIDFDVRVGINTGLVVVGAVGSDLRMEYTALGDAINLAARMEQTATPGTVQIAHDTYKLVRPLFEFEELGGIEVKGKVEPVLVYRVLGRKAVGGRARGIEGLQAEMVGRDEELSALSGVMADLKQGVGRIVCVLGEAGLGKSRLIAELRSSDEWSVSQVVRWSGNRPIDHATTRLSDYVTAPSPIWYETPSLSYETSHAYGLFQRLIRTVQGIAYNDPPPVIREKLASLVECLAQGRRARAMQVVEALFGLDSEHDGLPLEAEAFRRELFEAMHAWWRVRFSERPTVLVFDDMHWSDAASIELLRQLLPLTAEIPLVLLCAMRAERQAPAWQIKTAADEEYQHRYTEVLLRPLSEADSNELVNRLLSNADLPERLRASILEKSGGNPFFIEEVVRTLIDSGAVVAEERPFNGETRRYWRATSAGADFPIPENLQLLLAARMDRLEDLTRGTLQIASVIGRSFYHRVLQAVDEANTELDQRLGTLLRLDMIREAARVPEVEYAFRNPLTQEAVYQTILLKRRREFHRRVGEAMEALYPDRLERLYGLLAHHFALAGLRDKAIEYSRQASQQAVALYAYDDAVRNLRAALALIEPWEHSEIHLTLLEELGDVYRLLRDGRGAIAQYQQALELLAQRDVSPTEGLTQGERGLPGADTQRVPAVRLHRKIVQVVTELKWTVGVEYLREANESRLASRASLEEALPLLETEAPHHETVRVLVALSTDAWRIQEPPDWEAAQRFAQRAVNMAEQLQSGSSDHSPVDLSQALGALANVLDGRSLLREHLQVAERRLALCQQHPFNDVRETIEALRSAGAARMYVGEYEQALPCLREAEELAVRAQVVEQQANALGLQAQCWFRLDRWDDVLATEEQWRDLERGYTRERVGET